MFHVRNINRMERAYLQLLQYNTIISASQYAQYYFSLRNVVRQPAGAGTVAPTMHHRSSLDAGSARPSATRSSSSMVGDHAKGGAAGSGRDNFRSKYFMTLNVPAMSKLQEQSAAVGQGTQIPASASGVSDHLQATSL
mmetsp:Transcript_13544/g.28692  ORF Transcript_13544/g.28692 Transcript_13544/m.28692 type:complete len:138 (-) Transcript_13544:180-593(-)